MMNTKDQPKSSKSDVPAKNRAITITVKTKELYDVLNEPGEQAIDNVTYLVDDEGLESRFGEGNKEYETIVFMGKNITWNIRSFEPLGEDRGYEASLVSVSHNPTDGNPNFFDSDTLTPGKDGKIQGTISRNPNLKNKDDSYTINFKIIHNGKPKPYPLDPKLKLNQ